MRIAIIMIGLVAAALAGAWPAALAVPAAVLEGTLDFQRETEQGSCTGRLAVVVQGVATPGGHGDGVFLGELRVLEEEGSCARSVPPWRSVLGETRVEAWDASHGSWETGWSLHCACYHIPESYDYWFGALSALGEDGTVDATLEQRALHLPSGTWTRTIAEGVLHVTP